MYRILDLDNCISDDGWRIGRIDWQHSDPDRRYFNYHALAPFDLLGNGQLLATPARLVIFTARPVIFRAPTEEWLRRNRIEYVFLLMRNVGQNAPSATLKQQQLIQLEAHCSVAREEIECAYDDRADVVEMYRKYGLRAEVAAIHDACAMTRPTIREAQSV